MLIKVNQTLHLCLRFKATLKVDKEGDDLELNFKGTRKEESLVIITNY